MKQFSVSSLLLGLYLLISLVNLLAEAIPWPILVFFSKPLLMTVLSLYFALETRWASRFSRLIGLALIFAFGGDVLLMMAEYGGKEGPFFLLGLGSFLLTQTCYLLAFKSLKHREAAGLLVQQPWLILLFLLYLLGFDYLLWPGLDAGLRVPVLAYSIVIVAMSATPVHVRPFLPAPVFRLLFLGVLLFVLSDSLIGLSKFRSDLPAIPYVRVWIMATYLAAQFLIVKGAVEIRRWQG